MSEHFIKDPNRYNNSKNSLKRPFSICIVDEASQCVEPEALLPLKLGFTKMIMVGDPEQLPATVTSLTAKSNRFDTSMFTRLFRFFEDTTATALLPTGGNNSGNIGNPTKYNSPVQRLVYQYRMHSEIIKWPNSFFYGNLLCNGSISRTSSLKPYVVRNFIIFPKNDMTNNTLSVRCCAKNMYYIYSYSTLTIQRKIRLITIVAYGTTKKQNLSQA
jgi:superfamily I DNA and/or RNA helicase